MINAGSPSDFLVLKAKGSRSLGIRMSYPGVRQGGGGGWVLPEKLGGSVWPTSQNPYHVYDQNL